MFVGMKSFIEEDGTPTIQLWDAKTKEQVGEFEIDSPMIPKNVIVCDTVGELDYWLCS